MANFFDQFDAPRGAKSGNFFDQFDKPAEPRGTFAEIGAQAYAGATIDLPKMVGQAAQWMGAGWGGDLAQWASEREAAHPELAPQLEGRGLIGRALSQGARALPPSAAMMIPAAVAAPLGVPAAIGASAAGAFGLFGASQAQETYDKLLKEGVSDSDAKQAAYINLLIEGGGETIGNWAGLKLMGIGAKAIGASGMSPVQAAIKGATETAVWKPFLKQLPQTALIESATEFGQNFGEKAVEKAYGSTEPGTPLESGIQGAEAALGMTALLAPFGLAGFSIRAKQNQRVANALEDKDVDPVQRMAAAQAVYQQLLPVDKDAAKAWAENSAIAISSGVPIIIDEQTAKPVTEESQTAEAVQNISTAKTIGEAIQTAAEATAEPVSEKGALDQAELDDLVRSETRDLGFRRTALDQEQRKAAELDTVQETGRLALGPTDTEPVTTAEREIAQEQPQEPLTAEQQIAAHSDEIGTPTAMQLAFQRAREKRNAETVRGDAGQIRQGSEEGQPSLQPGTIESRGDLQQPAQEPANVGGASRGGEAQVQAEQGPDRARDEGVLVPSTVAGQLAYRGAKSPEGAGALTWYTTEKSAAQEYALLDEGGQVTETSIKGKKLAGPDQVRRIAIQVKIAIPEDQSAYSILSPEQFDGAERLLAAVKAAGFDGVHLPTGEDFAPSGKPIESVGLFRTVSAPAEIAKPAVIPPAAPAAQPSPAVPQAQPETAPAVEPVRAPEGQEVERFQGQYGRGMAAHPARIAMNDLATKRPELTWTVEPSTAHPDRFDVVGRKPATTAQPALAAPTIAKPEKAAPAPVSQAANSESMPKLLGKPITEASDRVLKAAERGKMAEAVKKEQTRRKAEAAAKATGSEAAKPEYPSGNTDATLARFRPKQMVIFSKPYAGKTGAKLLGYEWKWRPESIVDKRGEDRDIRVSDWEEAVTNPATNRDIVHQFQVETTDGHVELVSAETAAKVLGVSDSTVRSSAKRLLEQEMRKQQEEARAKAEADAIDAMDAQPSPAAAIEAGVMTYANVVRKRALAESRFWGEKTDTLEREYASKKEYGFLVKNGRYIFGSEWAGKDSELGRRGWKDVTLKASDIWDENGNDKKARNPSPPPTNPQEVAPNRSETAEGGQGKIADFGEKIAGARKDYAAKLTEAKDADIAAVPLSQSWPEPDYQKLFDAGTDPWAVGFMHAARDEIPTKPSQSWKLQRWVTQVEQLRGLALGLADGKYSVERAKELMAAKPELNPIADRIELYQEVGHSKSLKGIRVTSGQYSVYNKVEYKPPKVIWSVESKAAKSAMSHWPKMLATGDTRAEAIANFKKTWLETTPEQDATKAVDFQIYSKRDTKEIFIGKKIGTHVVELKGGFVSAKDARAWKEANQAELVRLLGKYKEVPYERRETNSPRVGIDHRNGADVTPAQFTEAFGFRGVQFGNYVEDARRQQDLNDAYDALTDLAGVLGIPSKALSLNGELGLAFGARGTGGIRAPSAHYEPGQVVINLTKVKDAGSLAHEWFHGVDNYFSRKAGNKSQFLTETQAAKEGVRPEMLEAFKQIVRTVTGSELLKRSLKLDQTRSKPYWATRLEMAARSFEAYVVAKLQDQNASNDYLANIVSEDYWKAAAALGVEKENTYPYPTTSEMTAIRAAFDHFFQTVETKQTDKGIALLSRTFSGPGRLTLEDAKAVAGVFREKFKGMAPVHVRTTPQSIRSEVSGLFSEIKRLGGENDTAGAWHEGEVYLFADNLHSPEHAAWVLLHEGTHHGLRGQYGSAINPVLMDLYFKNKMVHDAANEQLHKNPALSRVAAVEEALANMGADNVPQSAMERLVAGVRRLIRGLGFNLDVTDADVRDLVARALDSVKNPPKGTQLMSGSALAADHGFFRPASDADIKLLKIPPAWTDVYVNADPAARLAAVGTDRKGRTQYLYSAEHTSEALRQKFERQREFQTAMPELMHKIEAGVAAGVEEAHVLRLLALSGFRVGGAVQTGETEAIGATTLRPEHARVEGDTVYFDFTGKRGIRQQHEITDAVLARDISERITSGNGKIFDTNDAKVRRYLAALDERFIVHDFRTWKATATAQQAIASQAVPITPAEYWEQRDAVADVVADTIGDTRAVTLESYIDPAVFDGWRQHAGISENAERPRRTKKTAGTKTAGTDVGEGSANDAGILRDASLYGRESAGVTALSRTSLGTLTADQDAALRNVHGDPVTWRTKLQAFRTDWQKNLVQGLFDQFAPIADYSKSAYIKARSTKGGESTLEALLVYGKVYVDKDGAYRVEYSKANGLNGFAKVIAELHGEHDRFLEWVAAQRAERLKAIGLENLYADADIAALKTLNQGTMKDGQQRAIAYAKALRELNDWNDSVLKIASDSGLIDDATRQMYKDVPYVPFYRLQDEGQIAGFGMKAGLVNQYAWKKLKGGTEHLNDDLLANLLQNWSHLITASAKNRAAKATLEAAVAAKVAIEVPAGAPGKGHVSFSEGGKDRVFTVSDPRLMDAIAAMNYAGLGSVGKPFITMKRWLTIGVTVNPAFKIRNLIRDSIQAIGTAELSYNPAKNIVQGFKATELESETRAQLLAGGGMIRFGSMLDGNNADRTRRLIDENVNPDYILDDAGKLERFWKTRIMPAFDAYQEFGDRGEQISRAALYEQLTAKGMSHEEAAFWARDLMDFSMSGKWGAVRVLIQIVPFMNARLQGIYKLGRATKADYRRMATTLGAVGLASIALMLAYGDDDDWKKREDWDRDNYWWFKIGGVAFRIPKPFEVGAVGTLAERSVEYMISDEMTGKRFRERIAATVFNQLNMNPTPQLVKPLMDIYANKDAFTGRPIETQGMENLRKQDRATERTSEIAKFLGGLGLPDPTQLAMGQWNTLSPVQIDALVRGYFGWLGSSTTTALDWGIRPMMNRGERPDMKLRDVFLVGGFAETLPSGSSRYVTQMYDQAKIVEEAYGSYRDALKRGDTAKAQEILSDDRKDIVRHRSIEALKRAESVINSQIRMIESSRTMSGADKRLRLDALERRKDDIARRAVVRQ